MRARIAAWRRATSRGGGSHAAVVLLAAAIATAATLVMIAPRITHTFPSMVDDWYSIEYAVEQLPEALTGRSPEELRYRPAWVVWSAAQWHTLGAPTHRFGPQVWGVLRVGLLALGLAALAATIVRWPPGRGGRMTISALVAGVPLVVMTMPGFAVNLARWGPQEPLQIGLMSLGAALIVWSLRAVLSGSRSRDRILSLALGVALWWFGVLQKETSLAVLVLAPFLWPYVRRNEWRNLVRERPRLVAAVAGGVVAPLALAAVHTIALASAETRVYGVGLSPEGLPGRLLEQLSDIDHTLETPVAWLIIASAFLSLIWAIEREIDWLALGLLACALASAAWVAQTGIFVSRYYLPVTALVVLALVRTASGTPPAAARARGRGDAPRRQVERGQRGPGRLAHPPVGARCRQAGCNRGARGPRARGCARREGRPSRAACDRRSGPLARDGCPDDERRRERVLPSRGAYRLARAEATTRRPIGSRRSSGRGCPDRRVAVQRRLGPRLR